MEKSNIWIALIVLGVLTGFFFVAYFTMSKSKTNTIAVRAPMFYSSPSIQPNYVVDTSYHNVNPAPQMTNPTPTVVEPMATLDVLPTTPIVAPTTIQDLIKTDQDVASEKQNE